jgi:hypothetical protein
MGTRGNPNIVVTAAIVPSTLHTQLRGTDGSIGTIVVSVDIVGKLTAVTTSQASTAPTETATTKATTAETEAPPSEATSTSS